MIIVLKPQLPNRVVIFLKILFALTFGTLLLSLIPDSIFKIPAFISLLMFIFLIYKNKKLFSKKFVKIAKFKFFKNIKAGFHRITAHGIVNTEKLSVSYSHTLRKILDSKSLRLKTLIFIIVFSIVSYALVPLGIVKNEFFPKTDEETIYISVELPSGTSKDIVSQEMAVLINEIVKTDAVKKAIKDFELDYVPENLTGGRLIEELNKAFDPETVSKHLSDAGIKGIRYLDEGSRKSGKGTSNFVVFDPSNVKILEQNSKPMTRKEIIEQELEKVAK